METNRISQWMEPESTKLTDHFQRMIYRAEGAHQHKFSSIAVAPHATHTDYIITKLSMGEFAPATGELDDLKQSDLWEALTWNEWAAHKARTVKPRHPMIEYYEDIVDRYDTRRAIAKLRQFIALCEEPSAPDEPTQK